MSVSARRLVTLSPNCGRVRERRRCLTADDGGSLVDQRIVLESRHHEQGKIDPASAVALQHGIPDVLAPYG